MHNLGFSSPKMLDLNGNVLLHSLGQTFIKADICWSGHSSKQTFIKVDIPQSGHLSKRTFVKADICWSGHSLTVNKLVPSSNHKNGLKLTHIFVYELWCPLVGLILRMSTLMNVCFDECPLWWMSALMNVRFDECPLWWMSALTNVRFDKCPLWQISSLTNVRFDECPLQQMSASPCIQHTKKYLQTRTKCKVQLTSNFTIKNIFFLDGKRVVFTKFNSNFKSLLEKNYIDIQLKMFTEVEYFLIE